MKKLLLLAAGLTFLVACEKDEPNTPGSNNTNPSEIVSFLKAGNKWVYDLAGTDSAGNSFAADSVLMLSVKKDDGDGYFTCEAAAFGSEPDTIYFYKDADEFGEATDKSIGRIVVFKKDSKVGDSYTSVEGTDTTFSKILSLSEPVTVPAGSFTCMKIERSMPQSTDKEVFYIDRKNGYIKIDSYSDNTLYQSLKLNSKSF
jgi:hypothetical protein